jgi:ribosomal peptide maturation radical SAM protein 1
MYTVSLVNMPFAALHIPSLGLTQLKSVLEDRFGEHISVKVQYVNHDFARYLGVGLYKYFSLSVEAFTCGVGEWFFRQDAFPETTDNGEEYFRRFYPRPDEQTKKFKRVIQEKRQGVGDFMDTLIDRYSLDRFDLVGFTSMFHQNTASFAMARRLKARNPDIVVVMGGANCEVPMGNAIVKHVPQVDFAFSGPSLKGFPEFVGYCMDGEMDKCHQIDGVFSKRNDVLWPPGAEPGEGADPKTVYVGPIGEELDIDTKIDLDYAPFLELHEKNYPDNSVEKVLLFETSRGCWWGERQKCTFCGFNGLNMHYRSMSPERAIEQFESLFKYASGRTRLRAVDNAMPLNYPREVFAKLDTPPGIMLSYEMKASIKEEDARLLAKARVKDVQVGIEALNTSSLRLMRKGTNAFQNVRFLKYCSMYDFSPRWNILVGFPREEEQVYEKYVRDIPILMHLPPPTGVHPIRFDRYSHYFYNAEEYGLDLHPNDYYELVYPFDEQVLRNLAYYFVDDQNFRAHYFQVMVKWIGKIRQEFDVWWNRWHGEDQSVHPALYFKQSTGGRSICDSRSGEMVEYQIPDSTQQLLDYLDNRPRTLASLSAHFDHALDLDREIDFLRKRRLIFEEAGRGMSLVLPREPVQLTLLSIEARRVRGPSVTRGIDPAS